MLRETLMTHVFRHPKFYRIPRDKEEARAQLKVPSSNSDQVISGANATAKVERAPGPGHKQQATSKQEGAGNQQSTSSKAQATSLKP